MSKEDRLDELQLLKDENTLIKTHQQHTEQAVTQLKQDVLDLQSTVKQLLQELTAHDERHATMLGELNRLKETVMDSNSLNNSNLHNNNNNNNNNSNSNPTLENGLTNVAVSSSLRSIPAPSKILVEDQKKKDNRLVELRRITKEYMNVEEEEAGLRLYKLQKTMVHVVSNLKKYMKDRNEDICKSWKSIDITTQRVAFEMVEREALSLGVPLNLCIGYWGARRLISKSWANALRTTKKHIKPEEGPEDPKDDGGDDSSGDDDDHNRICKKIKIDP
ncbi:hypothetical protein MFLAVUS_004932 [Mucor flavus]|uniref:Uncharacterized protein n=1 Tax=Mucor flavus TaxID=439312 RepID=A0ABP9YXA1_9FUNG